MKTTRRLSEGSSILFLALALAACSSSGSSHPARDGGATCQHGGKAYNPGQVVALSTCTRCVCLVDGTLGMCTGNCSDAGGISDAMAPDAVRRIDGGTIDAPAVNDAPSSTDLAPKADSAGNIDVAPGPDSAGNTDVAPTPDTKTVDAPKFDAVADSAPKTDARNPDVAPKPDTAVTCSYGGKSYAIGQVVTVSACTTCTCQTSGTLGMCTGACAGDSGTDTPDAAELCMSTGGYVTQRECCSGISDFPSTCGIGACGCGATGNMVKICDCADGCFVPDVGCMPTASPNTNRGPR